MEVDALCLWELNGCSLSKVFMLVKFWMWLLKSRVIISVLIAKHCPQCFMVALCSIFRYLHLDSIILEIEKFNLVEDNLLLNLSPLVPYS